MAKIKVGIIGCGTIGSAIAKSVLNIFSDRATLDFLCDHTPERAIRLRQKLGSKTAIVTIETLIRRSDFIVEAASASVSGEIARQSLREGKEVLIMSVGGLLAGRGLPQFTSQNKGRLWIPSGAIAGVDGLLAACEGGIRSVKLITRKPPAGLRDAPYFLIQKFPELKGRKEYCVFKGNAKAAVKAFPQNINVAAVLSLAGIGPAKTKVEIWTSRAYQRNQHEIILEGRSGRIHSVTQNLPSNENPKTSALAIYSAIATLRKIFSRIRIGT